ncbi:sigma-70 family RNA polymerase sigma factor [Oceanobacter sp. 4_MG-2023]|uniref:sigma-70 family RNA polymerase sigma factor n=1 Tax=Oceanobacter sp. 4_MG-2023 TaxID=3062623 RepID=UPI0027342C56|nr:sigma-70 family RNA polymerase sigma factor [Oceanobacter sp. 4_MG-2023]MDP2547684.1 sigma-70 family RNA polymerase sigma factor [Oceanobacter sp. 4_MG-2023]
MECLLQAIRQHEAELRAFLQQRVTDKTIAEDLLQEVLLRTLQQGARFCAVQQPRAWMFRVARNVIIDNHRRQHPLSELPEDIPQPDSTPELDDIDLLSECLSRNLARLNTTDREILEYCDLNNQTVKSYATSAGISLSAAKARLLRARQRLRHSLVEHCHVQFDEQGKVCSHRRPSSSN